jgi:hypothetical protein
VIRPQSRLTLLLFLLLTAGAAPAQVTVDLDTVLQGRWTGSFGQCGWVLPGYKTEVYCELPILEGANYCDPVT